MASTSPQIKASATLMNLYQYFVLHLVLACVFHRACNAAINQAHIQKAPTAACVHTMAACCYCTWSECWPLPDSTTLTLWSRNRKAWQESLSVFYSNLLFTYFTVFTACISCLIHDIMCLSLEEDTPRTLVLVIFVFNAKGRPNRATYQLHYPQSIQIF